MSEFWMPSATPPQVSEEAKLIISEKFLEHGMVKPTIIAHQSLMETEELLGAYTLELGSLMSKIGPGIRWHKNILKIGAGLAWDAYLESGCYQEIGVNFALAELMAEIDGVPESYICSLSDDQNLISLIDSSLSKETDAFLRRPEIRHVLNVGAGCVRYYLEQTLKVG